MFQKKNKWHCLYMYFKVWGNKTGLTPLMHFSNLEYHLRVCTCFQGKVTGPRSPLLRVKRFPHSPGHALSVGDLCTAMVFGVFCWVGTDCAPEQPQDGVSCLRCGFHTALRHPASASGRASSVSSSSFWNMSSRRRQRAVSQLPALGREVSCGGCHPHVV